MFDFAVRAQLNRIEAKLDLVLRREGVIIQEGNHIMTTLSDVQAQEDQALAKISANTDALSSVKAALDAQTAKIADLQTQLDAAIAANDPTAIQAVSDKMAAILAATDTQATAEAALTNTPAAPAA